jgi:hypothetical protein
MEMGTLWIMALALGALPLLMLALMGSYRLGRRQRRDEVVIALMDDDAFVRDMGALDRARDQIRDTNTRYAQWRRSQAREVQATGATGTAGAGAGHE